MIWISEVLPPSTREEFPPYKPEFMKRAERVSKGFDALLESEMVKIHEVSILRNEQFKSN